MKLEQVTIQNFRQYLGDQEPILFARTPTKNVTLIYGVNGAGKSNLFKAINWCIYGEGVLNEEGLKKGQVPNKEAIRKIKVLDSIEVKVQVTFSHKGEKYLLTRSLECIKDSETTHSNREEVFLMMKIDQNGNSERVKNPLGQINVILPENVRTYFLFDGEKIDNFAKPSSSDDVRNAIYNVLKLEILERGKEHLDDVAKDYRKELRDVANFELQTLLTGYEKKKDQKEKLEQKQIELQNEIHLARSKIQEINTALEGMKESSDLQIERERLEEERKKKDKELKQCVVNIQKVATSSINRINGTMLQKAVVLLDTKRVKGEIPSNIRRQFLQDIIERQTCICGRPFFKEGPESKCLAQLQQGSVSGALEEEVINLNGALRGIQSEMQLNVNNLDTWMQHSVALRDEMDILETAISEISQKLKDSRVEDIGNTEKQREGFLNDVDKNIGNLAINENSIDLLNSELKQLDIQIKNAKESKEIAKKLKNKMVIAQNASNAIGAIYQQFADKMRTQIEARTKEIFKTLIWKESQFTDVRLDKDYHLEVIDRWNHSASPELSAGERQVLSLSFITALSQESEEEAPLVMDTPFGRLSKTHRERITLNIPNLADQLVLFITDEEMNEKMLQNLNGRVGETYHLNFDDQNGCTTIERK